MTDCRPLKKEITKELEKSEIKTGCWRAESNFVRQEATALTAAFKASAKFKVPRSQSHLAT